MYFEIFPKREKVQVKIVTMNNKEAIVNQCCALKTNFIASHSLI